jgi:hypothetical protein
LAQRGGSSADPGDGDRAWSKIEAADKSDSIYALQLTMRGWEKYAELKEIRTGSRTAFMAMKFGDPQLDQVVDAYFKPAVRRTGFELKKLTDEQPPD